MTEPDAMLTVAQVARRLAVSEETVRRYLRDAKLRGVRIGVNRAGWRIEERDLEAFLRARSNVKGVE
jgi:excisionase family DNA binding protein